MTDLILKTGKVQTRDGREVRIYATDAGGAYPVHGAIKLDHDWAFETWTLSGSYTNTEEDHRYDLTPIPQVKYFNVYTSKNGDVSFGCGFNNIGNAKYHGIQYAETAGPFETYKYLDGEITKVEESSNAD